MNQEVPNLKRELQNLKVAPNCTNQPWKISLSYPSAQVISFAGKIPMTKIRTVRHAVEFGREPLAIKDDHQRHRLNPGFGGTLFGRLKAVMKMVSYVGVTFSPRTATQRGPLQTTTQTPRS